MPTNQVFRILQASRALFVRLCATCAVFAALIAGAHFAVAEPLSENGKEPDYTGSFQVATGEYKFPAEIDPTVLADVATELWARVFWPKDLSQPRPIVFLLHGNHSTCGQGKEPRTDSDCSYTNSGTCPDGMIVTPNHEGYSYFAQNLASFGYIVVSINANRGITCGDAAEGDTGLILARGKLILKHLATWRQWSTTGGAPEALGAGAGGFIGAVDFTNVGLFGHSRGGEGVRAAYNLYHDKKSPWKDRIPNLDIRGIFEVGAVDGQSSRVLDAENTAWNQLLPMCDGDVSDLQGRKPFERMLLKQNEKRPTPKSLYMVWGTNHNFFNTEWQNNDSRGCYGHEPIYGDGYQSEAQQKIARVAVLAFFLGHVGRKSAKAAGHFNPSVKLPAWETKIATIDRDYVPTFDRAFDLPLDDFSQRTGVSSNRVANSANGIRIEHESDDLPSHARIEWKKPGKKVFAQFNWAKLKRGKSINNLESLDFRIARQDIEAYKDSVVPTEFSVALVDPNDRISQPVNIAKYRKILGPASMTTVFQTIRIPIASFKMKTGAKIRGVRFIFNGSKKGAIYLANVRFSSTAVRDLETLEEVMTPLASRPMPFTNSGSFAKISQAQHIIDSPAEFAGTALRYEGGGSLYSGRVTAVDISVRAPAKFPVTDELPTLVLGEQRFTMGRFGANGSTETLTFKVPLENLRSLPESGAMYVQLGSGSHIRRWRLPDYQKSQLIIE